MSSQFYKTEAYKCMYPYTGVNKTSMFMELQKHLYSIGDYLAYYRDKQAYPKVISFSLKVQRGFYHSAPHSGAAQSLAYHLK